MSIAGSKDSIALTIDFGIAPGVMVSIEVTKDEGVLVSRDRREKVTVERKRSFRVRMAI